jgi:hypothetical protein
MQHSGLHSRLQRHSTVKGMLAYASQPLGRRFEHASSSRLSAARPSPRLRAVVAAGGKGTGFSGQKPQKRNKKEGGGDSRPPAKQQVTFTPPLQMTMQVATPLACA